MPGRSRSSVLLGSFLPSHMNLTRNHAQEDPAGSQSAEHSAVAIDESLLVHVGQSKHPTRTARGCESRPSILVPVWIIDPVGASIRPSLPGSELRSPVGHEEHGSQRMPARASYQHRRSPLQPSRSRPMASDGHRIRQFPCGTDGRMVRTAPGPVALHDRARCSCKPVLAPLGPHRGAARAGSFASKAQHHLLSSQAGTPFPESRSLPEAGVTLH